MAWQTTAVPSTLGKLSGGHVGFLRDRPSEKGPHPTRPIVVTTIAGDCLFLWWPPLAKSLMMVVYVVLYWTARYAMCARLMRSQG